MGDFQFEFHLVHDIKHYNFCIQENIIYNANLYYGHSKILNKKIHQLLYTLKCIFW